MIAYMEKNKDWCQFPDEAIAQLKTDHTKSVGFLHQGLHSGRANQENEGTAGGRAAARRFSRCRPARFEPRARRGRGALPDARPTSLVLRLAPSFALPFVQLARLDRPAGWQLLLAPCWQSTALAGLAAHSGPNLWHLALFLVGAIAMRGAGCTYNDILDRELDAGVERTRGGRCLPAASSVDAAAAFLVAQALVGLGRAALLQRVFDRARASPRWRSWRSIR